MFDKFPEYLTFFQNTANVKDGPEALLANEKFAQDHIVGNVMKAVDKLVININNDTITESVLIQLGRNHTKRQINKGHFEVCIILQ